MPRRRPYRPWPFDRVPDDRHGETDLYVIDVESRETRRLTATAAEESRPAWSADGREVLVSRTADGGATLYAIAYPSGTERVVHRVEGRNPMPLGAARILFATGDWKTMQLASAALDGSDVTRVSDEAGAIGTQRSRPTPAASRSRARKAAPSRCSR